MYADVTIYMVTHYTAHFTCEYVQMMHYNVIDDKR